MGRWNPQKEEAAYQLGLKAGRIAAEAFPGRMSSETHPLATQVMKDNKIKSTAERSQFCAGYGWGNADAKIEQRKRSQ